MAPDPRPVRVLVLDVDGVLTDGSIVIDDHGVESKRFHVRDGTAIRMWIESGGEVALITGRGGLALRHRAQELGIDRVVTGCKDKGAALKALLASVGCEPANCAVLGDDLPDLSMLRACGFPIAVADASDEVRGVAALITKRPGGYGAVREAIEHLLKSQGRWAEAVSRFEAMP